MSINYSTNKEKKNDIRNNNLVAALFLLPIFIIIIIFIIVPLINTFLRSFTNYNFIDSKEFINLANYRRIFTDDIAVKGIKNTLIITLLSTPITVIISFLFAWLSSKLHKNSKYILCIMYLIVSITFIVPSGLLIIFSSDIYGYFNAFFNWGKEPIYYIYNPIFLQLIMKLLPILLGIGPLFLIFTICFINKDNFKKYFHFAVSLQIIISYLSFYSIQTVTGYPSIMYYAHTLNSHIYDYLFFRFEVGYASTLLIVLLLILTIFLTFFNGIVWLVSYIIKLKKNHPAMIKLTKAIRKINLKSPTSEIIFIFLLCISILLMYPFIQLFFDSFKPLDEFFSYPPKIIAIKPTLDNYKNLFKKSYPFNSIYISLYNSIIIVIFSTMLMMITSILSGIGFSLLSNKFKKPLLICFTLTFVLSPVILMSYNQYNSIISNIFFSAFNSSSFGLVIYLSSKIFENCTYKYIKVSNFINSKDFIKYLIKILSLSLIASLSTWFYPFNRPFSYNKLSLFHLITQVYSITLTHVGSYSSLYTISMIIPLAIIILCTPLLINSLTKNHN